MERRLGYTLDITPPQGWHELLQSMNKVERVGVANALGRYCAGGIRNKELYSLETVRTAEVSELTGRGNIGEIIAQFLKLACESLLPTSLTRN